MPILSNQRHERFALELAKGQTADAAYEAAGYKRNRGNASSLKSTESISRRVAELQAEMASALVDSVVVNRETVIKELAKIGFVNIDPEAIKASDKRAALLNLAQIEGWVVEKPQSPGSHVSIKIDLSGLPDEQLAQLEAILGTIAGGSHGRGHTGGEETPGSPTQH